MGRFDKWLCGVRVVGGSEDQRGEGGKKSLIKGPEIGFEI